jgi:hypothetical protein
MRFRYVFVAFTTCLTACSGGAEEVPRTEQVTFDLGPSNGPDRLRMSIPVEYLDREKELRDLVWSEPALIVDLATFAPADTNRRGDRATGYLRVDWMREGVIAEWAGNTRLSYYSIYHVPATPLHGLERRLSGHGQFGDRSFLLADPEAGMMIECVQLVARVPMQCEMSSQYEKGLVIELHFDPVHLPKWREIQQRAEAFVRPKLTFGEQAALEL